MRLSVCAKSNNGIGEPLTAAERDVHQAGLISVLKEIHDDIDRAVFVRLWLGRSDSGACRQAWWHACLLIISPTPNDCSRRRLAHPPRRSQSCPCRGRKARGDPLAPARLPTAPSSRRQGSEAGKTAELDLEIVEGRGASRKWPSDGPRTLRAVVRRCWPSRRADGTGCLIGHRGVIRWPQHRPAQGPRGQGA